MNDAYLVAAGTGLRFILEDRGESILKTIAVPVPVSVTAIGDARNAVGFMIIELPFQETDLERAVAIVAKQTSVSSGLHVRQEQPFRSRSRPRSSSAGRLARWRAMPASASRRRVATTTSGSESRQMPSFSLQPAKSPTPSSEPSLK